MFLCPHSKKNHFTIVPVLVGALKRDGEKLYGQIFSKYLMGPANLFVISSDFCHWGKQSICLISIFKHLTCMQVADLDTHTMTSHMDQFIHLLKIWIRWYFVALVGTFMCVWNILGHG